MNDRLYRSMDDRVLAGVAGGLAEKMGMDPSIVRIVWALLVIASGGVFLLIYIVMAIVVPEEDDLVPYPGPPAALSAPPASSPAAASDGVPAGAPDAAPGDATPGVAAPGTAPTAAAPTSPPIAAAGWRAQQRAARRAARAARRAERDPGQASIVIGVVLILVGVWFLLEQYVPGINFDRLWPLALLVLGVVLLAFSFGGRPGPKGPDGGSR